jgi:sugar phosphate isomerase/epimerase
MGMTCVRIGFDDFSWLECFKESGISFLELEPMNRGWTPGDPKSTRSLLRLCEKHAVKCHSMHGYFFPERGHCVVDADPEARKNAVQENIKLIHAAADLGAKYIVMHLHDSGWRRTDKQQIAAAKQALEALLPEAERAGVMIAVENLAERWAAAHINALLDELRHPSLGICFDSGHAAIYGDPASELELCGPRLIGLHIHDFDPEIGDHILPFDGKINWQKLAAALIKTQYKGVLICEAMRRMGHAGDGEFIAAARKAHDMLIEITGFQRAE